MRNGRRRLWIKILDFEIFVWAYHQEKNKLGFGLYATRNSAHASR